MTDRVLAPPRKFSLRDPFQAEPLMRATGIALALSLAVTLPAVFLETRSFQGENLWIKPVKFQVALSIYVLSLAFFARFLPQGMTARRGYRVYMAIVVFCIAGEMAWIAGAAMFGTASHFNMSSPVMMTLYQVMGVFAVTLTSASLVYGIAIWRNRSSTLDPALRLSIALGLVLTFWLTVVVAGTMSAGTSHFVGVPVTGDVLPLMGWSREVGDLRVAHFFATHALHAVPVAGLLSGGRPVLVWAAASAYSAVVLGTFVQALGGLPLI